MRSTLSLPHGRVEQLPIFVDGQRVTCVIDVWRQRNLMKGFPFQPWHSDLPRRSECRDGVPHTDEIDVYLATEILSESRQLGSRRVHTASGIDGLLDCRACVRPEQPNQAEYPNQAARRKRSSTETKHKELVVRPIVLHQPQVATEDLF